MQLDENVNNIMSSIGKLLNEDSRNDNEKVWMENQLSADGDAYPILKKLKTSDIHLISLIGKYEPISVKKLPNLSGISQPTISRTIKRFAETKIVDRYYKASNNKETFVNLTSTGQKLFDVHDALEKHIYTNLKNIIDEYSGDDINKFVEILSKITNSNI
ncbi:MarR family transcriptional regulator [Apilactobacillus apisilvae]|uniref:MarR family transcriptional regulator n=1 Tax=Apilactobacillus apisilvae TaxID=2923364 RepID=A0ABY4PGL2_9LACO|nr:MarR family transcriptional regulator [Apilactobacillus apisilvae]UQS84775.1 MarR family transcriptional regulator [Apilactobacillus apisilvae]